MFHRVAHWARFAPHRHRCPVKAMYAAPARQAAITVTSPPCPRRCSSMFRPNATAMSPHTYQPGRASRESRSQTNTHSTAPNANKAAPLQGSATARPLEVRLKPMSVEIPTPPNVTSLISSRERNVATLCMHGSTPRKSNEQFRCCWNRELDQQPEKRHGGAGQHRDVGRIAHAVDAPWEAVPATMPIPPTRHFPPTRAHTHCERSVMPMAIQCTQTAVRIQIVQFGERGSSM